MTEEQKRERYIRWRIRTVWGGMKNRCNNPDSMFYEHYGGRGISVYKEWEEDFDVFYKWALENGYEEGLTIERVNNNGNYCPENCKWITQKEQANNKRSNVILEVEGVKMTVAQWAESSGLPHSTIRSRLKYGWSAEDSVSKPILTQMRNKRSGTAFRMLFDRIIKWQQETFPKATPQSKLKHLMEEIHELLMEFIGNDPSVERDKRIEEEYADAFLLLYGSAWAFGMNLDDLNLAISQKMDKNEKRKWQEPDDQGIVRHIKD